MASRLVSERLVLRGWMAGDAEAALGVYGDRQVARWLAPELDEVADLAAMRLVLQQWSAEDAQMMAPAGRWAIELRHSGQVIGGAAPLPVPPDDEVEMGWPLNRPAWGQGDAQEARLALAPGAFGQGIEPGMGPGRAAEARPLAH